MSRRWAFLLVFAAPVPDCCGSPSVISEWVSQSTRLSLRYTVDALGTGRPDGFYYALSTERSPFSGDAAFCPLVGIPISRQDGVGFFIDHGSGVVFEMELRDQEGQSHEIQMGPEAYAKGRAEPLHELAGEVTWRQQIPPGTGSSGAEVVVRRSAWIDAGPSSTETQVFREETSVSVKSATMIIERFIEHLAADDFSLVRDLDGDGENDTLLAVNRGSSQGYPIVARTLLLPVQVGRGNQDLLRLEHRFGGVCPPGGTAVVCEAVYLPSSGIRSGAYAEEQVLGRLKRLVHSQPGRGWLANGDCLDFEEVLGNLTFVEEGARHCIAPSRILAITRIARDLFRIRTRERVFEAEWKDSTVFLKTKGLRIPVAVVNVRTLRFPRGPSPQGEPESTEEE